jgi:hypothetical protein
MEEKKLEKIITNSILENRSIKLGDLLFKLEYLDLDNKNLSSQQLIDKTDKIFFLIEKYESLGLVKVNKFVNNTEKGSNAFNIIIKRELENPNYERYSLDPEKTVKKIHYLKSLIKERYIWELEAKFGLLTYKNNNLSTEQELRDQKNFRQALLMIFLTAACTALATELIGQLFDKNEKSNQITNYIFNTIN